MKSVISEIFEEGAENEKNNLSDLYKILTEQKRLALEELKSGLCGEQINILNKILDIDGVLESELISCSFKDGFRSGTRAIINMFGLADSE